MRNAGGATGSLAPRDMRSPLVVREVQPPTRDGIVLPTGQTKRCMSGQVLYNSIHTSSRTKNALQYMSLLRCRSGGISITTVLSRCNRSARKRPLVHPLFERRPGCRHHANVDRDWFGSRPPGRTMPSSTTRNSFTCTAGDRSATSSRNNVPCCACSNAPGRVATAPVKAPRR